MRELRTTAAAMLSLTKNTVGNVFAVLRHYCGRDLRDRPVVPFGGRVYVVNPIQAQVKGNPFSIICWKRRERGMSVREPRNITLATQ